MRSQNTNRWRRPGQLELRLAELLAGVEERAEAANTAYFARARSLLAPEDWDRLVTVWSAREPAPEDIWLILDADEQAAALWHEMNHLDWSLSAAERGRIVSEHFWFAHIGRAKPPKEWGL